MLSSSPHFLFVHWVISLNRWLWYFFLSLRCQLVEHVCQLDNTLHRVYLVNWYNLPLHQAAGIIEAVHPAYTFGFIGFLKQGYKKTTLFLGGGFCIAFRQGGVGQWSVKKLSIKSASQLSVMSKLLWASPSGMPAKLPFTASKLTLWWEGITGRQRI